MENLEKKLTRHAWTVCVIYAVAAVIWIFLSDHMLAYFVDAGDLTRLQTWKGILFVLVTSMLLFFLVRNKNESLIKLFDKLRDQMQHFRDTFEQAAVGIVHISRDEEWIRVNRTMCEILGYTRREFRNLSLEDIVPPGELERGRELDRQLLEGQRKDYVTEKRYITKSGEHIYARLTKSGVYDSGGELKYLIAIIEDITPQKEAERELEQSLEQKKMLLAEIHHRVKNNLAIISGLMELQVYSTTDDQIRQILRESMMRIKSMALIHESYYEKGELAHVNLNQYMHEFLGYFKKAYYRSEKRPFDLELQAAPLKLNINQAIPCGLLLNELLINAFSHAFEDEQDGNIRIILDIEGNDVIMGIKAELIKISDSFDPETNSSLGTMIITALLKQLDANLDLRKNVAGHTITVTFRREDKKGPSNAYLSPFS